MLRRPLSGAQRTMRPARLRRHVSLDHNRGAGNVGARADRRTAAPYRHRRPDDRASTPTEVTGEVMPLGCASPPSRGEAQLHPDEMKRIFAASGRVPLRQAETFKGDTKTPSVPDGRLGVSVLW